MIRVRLQIEDGEIYDTLDRYGLIYINGSKRFAAPIKKFEETIYPEQSGKNISPKTTDDSFDYEVEFFIKTENLIRVNKKITRFNSLMYTQDGDVKTFKRITFYDDYKGVKIVGYPQPMDVPTKFWRDKNGYQQDVVLCKLIIQVNNPSLCDFTGSDVYVAGNSVIVDGDSLDNSNIQAGVEVYVENEKLIFKEL